MIKLAVDAIVEREGKILLVDRKYPPLGLALPGGMIEENESCETAVARELKEETNLNVLDLMTLNVYSKPDRDPRGRVVSIVFVVESEGEVIAGDDAKDFKWIPLWELKKEMLTFDHYEIIQDYLAFNSEEEEECCCDH
jgi:8-oxo-dGTP diphosphatase